MNIKVLKHERNRKGFFLNHKVLFTVDAWDWDNEEDLKLIEKLSIKVGYHPLGYGLYGGTIHKRDNGEHIAIFETGASAD